MLKRLLTSLLFIGLLLPLPPAGAELSQAEEARARRLINALGCKGCHRLERDGGSLAPELDTVGSRLSEDQLVAHLKAHSATRQSGFMPSYATTNLEDLQVLSKFLRSLR